jgi:hypothetical protein
MSDHFKPKSLLFYGAMIGSVTILFRVVSTYGEANLKAPATVDGRYVATQSLPGCPDTLRFVLNIQQSGIYVNGSLNLENAEAVENVGSNTTSPQFNPNSRLTLSGKLDQQQINLGGKSSVFKLCPTLISQSAAHSIPISIQGNIALNPIALFTGNITLSSGETFELIAERVKIPKEEKGSH